MQKAWGIVLLALFLFIAYQSIENSSQSAMEAMGNGLAKETACSFDAACVLQSGPSIFKSDVLKRQYQFRTDKGSAVVTCDRRYIWLGAWSCTSELGTL